MINEIAISDFIRKRVSIVIFSFKSCKGQMELVPGQVWGQWDKNLQTPTYRPQPKSPTKKPNLCRFKRFLLETTSVNNGIANLKVIRTDMDKEIYNEFKYFFSRCQVTSACIPPTKERQDDISDMNHEKDASKSLSKDI